MVRIVYTNLRQEILGISITKPCLDCNKIWGQRNQHLNSPKIKFKQCTKTSCLHSWTRYNWKQQKPLRLDKIMCVLDDMAGDRKLLDWNCTLNKSLRWTGWHSQLAWSLGFLVCFFSVYQWLSSVYVAAEERKRKKEKKRESYLVRFLLLWWFCCF